MRSNAYWETRARQRMARYHRAASSTIDTVTRAYDKAVKDLTTEIEAIFETFGNNGQLGPTVAKQVLNEAISRGEWDALKASLSQIKDDDMRRQVLAKLNAPAYRARITRLQALKAQAYVQSKVIADAELRLSTAGYVDTIQEAYYRTMFDLHKGLGFGFDFAAVPNRVVQTILKRPWSGQHFSNRIWGNTDILADQLTEVITAGFMSGAGLPAMRRQLQDLTGAAKFAAARLIRTETTYMANAAEIESYAEAGIEQYRFVATLDNRTSPICQDLDGQLFDVKDAVPSKNLPPMHPNCRSTTRAFLDSEALEKAERRARNPKTGETYQVPANMSYKEWQKQFMKPPSLGQDSSTAAGSVASMDNTGYNSVEEYITSARDVYSGWDKTDRKMLADELLKANGLNLQAEIHPLKDAFGQCKLRLNQPMQITSFELESRDARAARYQVKTTFHELFHAKAAGLTHDAHIIGFGEWGFCDDIFAEVSAHHFVREIGIAENITPSYASYLVNALPRLKLLPEFAHCNSIADFGEVAVKYRFGQDPTAEWGTILRHIRAVNVDPLVYGHHYLDYLEKNTEALVDQLLEGTPANAPFRVNILNDAQQVIDSIRTNTRLPTSRHEYVLNGILSIAMNHVGVMLP